MMCAGTSIRHGLAFCLMDDILEEEKTEVKLAMGEKHSLNSQQQTGLSEYVLLDASLCEIEKAGEDSGELARRAIEMIRFDDGRENTRLLRGDGCVCLALSSGISFLGLAAAADTPENIESLYLCAPEWVKQLERQSLTEHLDRFLLLERSDCQKLCTIYLQQDSRSGRTAWLLHEAMCDAEVIRISQCGDGVAALLSYESYDMLCKGLNEFFAREKCRCGISSEYDRRILAVGSQEKARRAAYAGQDGFFCSFSESRWQCFLSEAGSALDRMGYVLGDFAHSTLKAMFRYDKTNKTEYFASVYAYLLYGKNLKEAAAKLDIHRNTLDYRIKKAQAMFGLDLSDSGLCFELLLSYMLGVPGAETLKGAGLSRGEESCLLWQALKREKHVLPLSDCEYVLLCCDISDFDEAKRYSILRDVTDLLPECSTAFDDRTLLALCKANPLGCNDFADMCGELMKKHDCRGALSDHFPMERLDAAIGITGAALALGPQLLGERSIYKATETASFLLFALLGKNMQLSIYYCDEVMRVLQHDYENETELANSLYIYLSSFMDLKKAAEETALHRNTVDYRVRKILKFLDIENADRKLMFEMLCTYHMLAVADSV